MTPPPVNLSPEFQAMKTGERWGAYWKHADGWFRLFPPPPFDGTTAHHDAPASPAGTSGVGRRFCNWCPTHGRPITDMGPSGFASNTHAICPACAKAELDNFSGGGVEANHAGSVADGLAPCRVLSTVKPATCRTSARPAAELNLPAPVGASHAPQPLTPARQFLPTGCTARPWPASTPGPGSMPGTA